MALQSITSRVQVIIPGSILFALCLILSLIPCHPQVSFVAIAQADDDNSDPAYVAPFVPTPQEIVLRMLELAEIKPGDVLYDLGSGDGRIVITAAKKYGIKAVGFEINPALMEESRAMVKQEGLERLVEIREQDVRQVDFAPASVVTMYLYPAATLRLRSALRSQLKLGSRVVSHKFSMGDWQPDKTVQVKDSAGLDRTLHLWRIEADTR
jgi:hypothetical protein